MERVKTQIELDLSNNDVNKELQTRIENLAGQKSGLVYEEILSLQLETWKKTILVEGTK